MPVIWVTHPDLSATAVRVPWCCHPQLNRYPVPGSISK
jgi:hypothetical protein